MEKSASGHIEKQMPHVSETILNASSAFLSIGNWSLFLDFNQSMKSV